MSLFIKKNNFYNNRFKKGGSSEGGAKKSSASSKSKAIESANPVFEKWIIEWRDEAAARDLNSRHIYAKCLMSLRKYPLPLNSGKECIILEGFGDKICKLIDERLESYLADGGQLHEPEDSSNDGINGLEVMCQDGDDEEAPPPKPTKTSAPKPKKKKNVPSSDVEADSDDGVSKKRFKDKSNEESAESTGASSQASKAPGKRKASSKEYLPSFRSGPYALLVTLLNNESEQDATNEPDGVYMLKAQLMKEAQKHCDSSFATTDPNSRYSAWNSMSSLIKKNLVIKLNKLPARYVLTAEGRKLANRLLYGITEDSDTENKASSEASPLKDKDETPKKQSPPPPISHAKAPSYKLAASYSDDEIILDDDVPAKFGFEPKAKPTKKVQDDCIELDSNSDDDSDTQVINVKDSDSDIISIASERPVFSRADLAKEAPTKPAKSTKATPLLTAESEDLPDLDVYSNTDCFDYYSHENYELNQETPDNQYETAVDSYQNYFQATATTTSTIATTEKSKKGRPKTSKDESSSAKSSTQSDTTSSKKTYSFETTGSETTTSSSLYSSSSIKTSTTSSIYSSTTSIGSSSAPPAVFSLLPGTFDVMLFVDNCEQSHAKRQDLLIDELKKSNIKFDVGKLSIGDFVWIARPKNKTGSAQDLILNCIVERKRIDDFCSSIIDGRYKEQKFRLKKCAVSKVIYLIEEFGSIKHLSLPEKSITQADVNTQITDSFLVHHSTDPKDSAHYLIEMTHYLTRKYQNLKLNACSKSDLDEFYKNSKDPREIRTNLLTYDEFNAFSNKNKPMTIKEMFAKCLMKIHGLSQEKSLAILSLYPTPSLLMKEYSKCGDETARAKLLANLKFGIQARNLGPVISNLLSQLFYTNGPLP